LNHPGPAAVLVVNEERAAAEEAPVKQIQIVKAKGRPVPLPVDTRTPSGRVLPY
jgi:hypothetical protein